MSTTNLYEASATLNRLEEFAAAVQGNRSDHVFTLDEAKAALQALQNPESVPGVANLDQNTRRALTGAAQQLVSVDADGRASWTEVGQRFVANDQTDAPNNAFSTDIVAGGGLVRSVELESQSFGVPGLGGMIGPGYGAGLVAANNMRINPDFPVAIENGYGGGGTSMSASGNASAEAMRELMNVPGDFPEVSDNLGVNPFGSVGQRSAPASTEAAGASPRPAFVSPLAGTAVGNLEMGESMTLPASTRSGAPDVGELTITPSIQGGRNFKVTMGDDPERQAATVYIKDDGRIEIAAYPSPDGHPVTAEQLGRAVADALNQLTGGDGYVMSVNGMHRDISFHELSPGNR